MKAKSRPLRGVLVVSDMVDVSRMHQGSYISIFKYLPSWSLRSLPAWEVFHLLCVFRASSWSLRGCWRFLSGVLVAFDMVDVSRMHQGSFISIFKSLPAWEVIHLLCVSRASSWSLRGRWRFLRGVLVDFDMVDALRMHQGSYISIFKSLPSWKVDQLLGSPERHLSVFIGV